MRKWKNKGKEKWRGREEINKVTKGQIRSQKVKMNEGKEEWRGRGGIKRITSLSGKR